MSIEHPKSSPSGEEEDTSWIRLAEIGSTKEIGSSGRENVGMAGGGDAQPGMEAAKLVSPEALAEAEDRLKKSGERLAGALGVTGESKSQKPGSSFGERIVAEKRLDERIKGAWASAKRKAMIAFGGLSLSALGGMDVLMTMKTSAETTLNSVDVGVPTMSHAMQVLDMINGIGITGVEAGMGLAAAVPMVLLGLAKLKERNMRKTNE